MGKHETKTHFQTFLCTFTDWWRLHFAVLQYDGKSSAKIAPVFGKGVCQNRRFLQGEEQSSRVGYNHYYKKTAEVIRTWVNENGWRQAEPTNQALWGAHSKKQKQGKRGRTRYKTVTLEQKVVWVQNLFVSIITQSYFGPWRAMPWGSRYLWIPGIYLIGAHLLLFLYFCWTLFKTTLMYYYFNKFSKASRTT